MDKPTPETTELGLLKTLADMEAEIKSLRARVEQYKEDAERYRWLRESVRLKDVPPELLDAEVDKARKA